MTKSPKTIEIVAYTFGLYMFSLIFWYFFIVEYSWGILEIQIGPASSLYPLFFSVPMVVGISIYQFTFHKSKLNEVNHLLNKVLFKVGIPIFVISLSLIIFLPIDSDKHYAIHLYEALFN